MKKVTKIFVGIAFIIVAIASFVAGSYMKEQEYVDSRMQRCNALISFAIDKAENEDLSNQDIREALISNVYAAYEFCDRPHLSELLHDLWNTLIFEGDSYVGKEDMLVTELRNILDMMQIEN